MAIRELVFVIYGSEVGHECITLFISLIYGKRALPITWLVVKGRKGHLAESMHLDLLTQLQAILPKHCQMVFLGDGEFDGINLQVDDQIWILQVWFTKEGYGPVTVIAQWEQGFVHPIYLVTNIELPDEALYWYKKRFQIEIFFSDEKSRGFFLHKSHQIANERITKIS